MAVQPQQRTGWCPSRTTLLLLGLLVVGGLLLLATYTDYVFAALPFVFILACPLMHVFMHGGHGSHGQHHDDDQRQASAVEAGKEER